VGDGQAFAALVNRAFSMRRKTLKNALRGMLAESGIMAAGVDPGCRAETLDPATFAALALQLGTLRDDG
jgi:16S rRNA (adenine1518-N6/adenine1519-N6)-dimethyltransferase